MVRSYWLVRLDYCPKQAHSLEGQRRGVAPALCNEMRKKKVDAEIEVSQEPIMKRVTIKSQIAV